MMERMASATRSVSKMSEGMVGVRCRRKQEGGDRSTDIAWWELLAIGRLYNE